MQNDAWRKLLRRFIAYDVPDDMAACFDCDEARCPDEQFATIGRESNLGVRTDWFILVVVAESDRIGAKRHDVETAGHPPHIAVKTKLVIGRYATKFKSADRLDGGAGVKAL